MLLLIASLLCSTPSTRRRAFSGGAACLTTVVTPSLMWVQTGCRCWWRKIRSAIPWNRHRATSLGWINCKTTQKQQHHDTVVLLFLRFSRNGTAVYKSRIADFFSTYFWLRFKRAASRVMMPRAEAARRHVQRVRLALSPVLGVLGFLTNGFAEVDAELLPSGSGSSSGV